MHFKRANFGLNFVKFILRFTAYAIVRNKMKNISFFNKKLVNQESNN